VLLIMVLSAPRMHFALCAFDRLERLARAAVVSVLAVFLLCSRLHPASQRAHPHRRRRRQPSRRKQIWIDIFGTLFLLLPIAST